MAIHLEGDMEHADHRQSHGDNHYVRLAGMTVLSFISMYFLMYSMVDSLQDVYASFNQVYMAGLMTAPMVVIELLLMSGMYQNKRLNAWIIGGASAAGIAFFVFIRQQTVISDRQFLRSMIPHHSGAILMCENATLEDRRLKDLCAHIIAGQRAEIDQMRALLGEGAR
jgi:hypothetical protein